MTEEDAHLSCAAVYAEIRQWLRQHCHSLTREEKKFLRRHLDSISDPFATFYILIKIHKTPIASRPVVSYSGSLLHALAVWCDDKLQPLAQAQQAYLKSSFELKDQLEDLVLPPNAVLFTADARAMYTNIPTQPCLNSIREYLDEHFDQFTHVNHDTLLEALSIVMQNNIFRFGDTYWIQNNGAAMGAPPCPAWATMYFAPHEDNSCDVFSDNILYYKRYIDDIFGIWLRQPGDDAIWNDFILSINESSDLVWDFTDRSSSTVFLDLNITVTSTGSIVTSLYEKPLNLHSYLPPHSAHPPRVLRGLVKGMLYRFKTLNTTREDLRRHINQFYRHLLHRGYTSTGLLPLFNEALATLYPAGNIVQQPLNDHNGQPPDVHPLYLRIQYHPSDPSSATLQRIWRRTLFRPPGSRPLSDLDSYHRNGTIRTNRMIVCYRRAPNLENLISSKRNLAFKNGTTVSSFFPPME